MPLSSSRHSPRSQAAARLASTPDPQVLRGVRQAALAGETPVSAADAAASATITTSEVTPLIPAKPRSAIAALQHLLHDHNFLLFMTCSLLTTIVFMQSFVTLPLYL